MSDKKPLPPSVPIEGLDFRFTEMSDGKYLKDWLMEPSIKRWFPMEDEVEIDDAVGRWVGFSRYKCSITAVKNDIPCGITTLYLQPYKKLAHQCEFGIIVGTDFRNQGIGGEMLHRLFRLAKERFKIELIHLQVYADNPAKRLYERFGFEEFGCQDKWIKENDGTYTARLFMERYI